MNVNSSTRSRRERAFASIGIVAGALLVAGCGSVGHSEGTGDRANGKTLFTQKCGSCHTLADAGTQGQVGPNLDYAFAQARRDGLGESTFVQVVRGQIAYPTTDPPTDAPGMPADLVKGQDAEDVASYVAAVAGVGDFDRKSAAPATTEPASTAGGEGDGAAAGNAAAGKAVFTSSGCGGCHTLADAGAAGAVGPNLDEAKPPASLVVARVTNGKGAMPPFKGQLNDEQIADVAAYVSSAAGK